MTNKIFTLFAPRARSVKSDIFKEFAQFSKLKVTPVDEHSTKAFIEAPSRKAINVKLKQIKKKDDTFFDMRVL